jgi:methyl acetate hydrolase
MQYVGTRADNEETIMPDEQPRAVSRFSPIDAVLEAAVARGAVAGVVALAGDTNGILYEAAFGKRDLASDAAMDAETMFWFASMTKIITSVAAMQLVEQGKLSLDAPISTVLPGLAAPQVLEGLAPDGTPRLRPARGAITLRHLLTHTAGFGYETWNAELGPAIAALGLPRVPETAEQHARTPLLFDPGTRWNYSIATDLVGQAVAAASGQDFDRYLAAHVLRPLGMVDCTFVMTADQAARKARLHTREPDGSLTPNDLVTGMPGTLPRGGGGLHGTGRDYMRFLRMMLNGGSLDGVRILRPETVAEMGRNQIGAINGEKMMSAAPVTSYDAEFFPGLVTKWGLGFLINTERSASGRSPGGLCWAGLGNTYYWIDPRRGIAGVLLTQSLPFADPRVVDLLWDFERAAYAAVD